MSFSRWTDPSKHTSLLLSITPAYGHSLKLVFKSRMMHPKVSNFQVGCLSRISVVILEAASLLPWSCIKNLLSSSDMQGTQLQIVGSTCPAFLSLIYITWTRPTWLSARGLCKTLHGPLYFILDTRVEFANSHWLTLSNSSWWRPPKLQPQSYGRSLLPVRHGPLLFRLGCKLTTPALICFEESLLAFGLPTRITYNSNAWNYSYCLDVFLLSKQEGACFPAGVLCTSEGAALSILWGWSYPYCNLDNQPPFLGVSKSFLFTSVQSIRYLALRLDRRLWFSWENCAKVAAVVDCGVQGLSSHVVNSSMTSLRCSLQAIKRPFLNH